MFLLLHNSSNNFPCNFCLSWKRPVCSVRRDASSFPRGLILTFSQKLSSKSLEKSFVSTTEKMLLSPPGRVSSLLFSSQTMSRFQAELVQPAAGWITPRDVHVISEPLLAQHRHSTARGPHTSPGSPRAGLWSPQHGSGCDPQRQNLKAPHNILTQEPSKICLPDYVKCKESGFQSKNSLQQHCH